MTTQEIATKLVDYCRQGQYETAQKELYAQDALSIEPEHSPAMRTVNGLDAIVEKGHQFQAMVEKVHSNTVSDPVVTNNYFSVAAIMDLDFKGMGRQKMEEVCVYQVKDGKVVQEQFFY